MDIFTITEFLCLFFLQYFPNGLIYILAGYAFDNKHVESRYFLSSILLSVFGLLMKILSETHLFTANNILNPVIIILINIILLMSINKVTLISAITSSIAVMILQLIVEIVYLGLLNVEPHIIFTQSVIMRSLIGVPTFILTGLIVFMFYYLRMKKQDEIRRKNSC